MKKIILLLLIGLVTNSSKSCVCSPPNIYLEFYASKYVFTGIVISKVYATDSSTYTFEIEIDKQYKDGDKPKVLSFTWPSEAFIRKVAVSDCDYDVDIGNYLLVFAIEKNNKLNFDFNCSNSSYNGISLLMKKTLSNANQFNPTSFHINFNNTLFNDTKPITDINRLVKTYEDNVYEIGEGVIVMLDIDTNGCVTARNIWETNNIEINKINSQYFLYDVINRKYRYPKNELEKDVLKISKRIKKWEVMRFKISNQPVNSRQYISLSVDKNHKLQWKQFYFMIN